MTLQLDWFSVTNFLAGAIPQVDIHEEASVAGACSSFECGMHLGKPQLKNENGEKVGRSCGRTMISWIYPPRMRSRGPSWERIRFLLVDFERPEQHAACGLLFFSQVWLWRISALKPFGVLEYVGIYPPRGCNLSQMSRFSLRSP